MWLGKSTDQLSVALRSTRRRHVGEFVQERIVIAVWTGDIAGRGLRLGRPVHIHDAVAQMNLVARNADQPLHQKQVRLARLEKDHDVVALAARGSAPAASTSSEEPA